MTDQAEVREDRIARLARVSLFRGLKQQEQALLASTATSVEVCAGKSIFRKGDPSDGLYIVETGALEAVINIGMASEHVLGVFGPGDFLGKWHS